MSRARNALEPSPDAPVVNPYERFTQLDFDDYVGGLRNKIRDALDPRRGLRNRDRDSDASFGLPHGEFRMGRSVSVGESSIAASGQSVPRSSVEDERGERRVLYSRDNYGPESDASGQEDNSRPAPKPTIVSSGAGDSESPFVISDDEDDEPGPAAGEALTPRSKAHQLLGLQGADEEDEGDYDDEGDDEEEEEDEADIHTSSPLKALPGAGPLNLYDDIDDIELAEDDSLEENTTGDALDNPFDEGFAGSQSPPWPDHVSANDEVHDESHLQESANSLDEYFAVDMDHLPPGFSSTGFDYDASEPEMREYSGSVANPFSQMRDSGLTAGPSFSNEGLPHIFPTHDSDNIIWPTNNFSTGHIGGMPDFPPGNVDSTERISQGSTIREASQGIPYPSLPVFSDAGSVNIFDTFAYPPQNPMGSSFAPGPSQFYDSGDLTPMIHQSSITPTRPDDTDTDYAEVLLPAEQATHPDAIEEPRDDTVPQYSEDVGSAITPSLTPPLSPSGITLTAPDPSLLSDNSSVATSIPVALEPAVHAGPRIDSVEFDDGVEDLTLPEEVTQELNQDVSLLPDPHRVPEPTTLGTPVGVAGLATRIIEPSVWAEPPTPSRSDYADDGVNNVEDSSSRGRSEEPISPQQAEPIEESQPPAISRNLARVRWRDHYTSTALSTETPRDVLDTPEQTLGQPAPHEQPAETPQEELSSLEHALTLPTPIQTPSETQHEHGSLFLAAVSPTEGPLETPREELNTLEQFLINGGSISSTPLTMRGNLTRESTMTDATWSQGPVEASLLRHATSATLTGESYFPSQPIPSPSRRTSSEQGETQNAVDESQASPIKHIPDVDHYVARSNSPFSDDSPLSEDDQPPSVSKPAKTRKRVPNLSRLSSSVGAVGKRELKALQDSSLQLDSAHPRRKPSNKPTVQTNKAPSRAKGKQKASPVTRKEPLRPATATRLRALRSSSLVSSTVSKRSSPTSTAGHEDSNESSRDELDLLEEADEEREREHEDAGSEHEDEHPKRKRKRHPRVSMPGDDEDYLPEDAERSLKKRKLEAKEHDLDESLDTIDLASVLAMAEKPEAKSSPIAPKRKKPKNFTKNSTKILQEEPLEAESPSGESSDRGSDFKPSPKAEPMPEELKEVVEIDAEAFLRLSPAAQARFRRLNPDSRAYKPPRESDSESDDDVEVSRRDLVADLKDIVEGLDEPAKVGRKEGGSETAIPQLESEGDAAVPRKKEKRKRSGGTKKSKTADPATTAASQSGVDDDMVLAPEKPSNLLTAEGSRDNDVDMELGGDGDVVGSTGEKGPANVTQQPPLQESSNERSGWAGYIPFGSLFRSNNARTLSKSVSPATDRMEVD